MLRTLILALPLLTACQHTDKAAHFAVGAGVSHVVAQETGNPAAGCLAALGVGVLKELVDDVSDPADIIATTAGCGVGLAF
jgi:predicted Fe-Mo cluster-binding NifX family protein